GGNSYFQIIEDEASRFKWCFLLKETSDANQHTMDLLLKLEKEHVINIFSSNKGGEFLNNALKAFLASRGIDFLTT
ncbi:hypothetical protein PHYSODRAFT_421114, partial [Phytophthora sojae]